MKQESRKASRKSFAFQNHYRIQVTRKACEGHLFTNKPPYTYKIVSVKTYNNEVNKVAYTAEMHFLDNKPSGVVAFSFFPILTETVLNRKFIIRSLDANNGLINCHC